MGYNTMDVPKQLFVQFNYFIEIPVDRRSKVQRKGWDGCHEGYINLAKLRNVVLKNIDKLTFMRNLTSAK